MARPEVTGKAPLAALDSDTTLTPAWLRLESIIPLDGDKGVTVEKVTNLSRDTVERHHSDKIVDLSPRRRGMKLKHALEIAGGCPGTVDTA